jgi:hypothetical protein
MKLTVTEAASRQRRALRVSRLYDRPSRRDQRMMETDKLEEKSGKNGASSRRGLMFNI